MIDKEVFKELKNCKNLLAFSAGVDSTALFFILQKLDIEFDIAIVDYGIRDESKDEVLYAKELANRFNKKIFIKNAPKFDNNFEANAREFRYDFFENIIRSHNYHNLITAHHLNDKLEWFLMRLSKGAGTIALSGMQKIEQRDKYKLIRPLLDIAKAELIEFLDSNNIKYFIDKSNFDTKYERNRFRPIVDELLSFGKDGYVKSFKYLNQDASILKKGFELIYKEKSLRVIRLDSIDYAPYALNIYLKELGYLISSKEQLLIKDKNSIVVGRKWAVEVANNILYIAPYIKIAIPKEIKELYRVSNIPPKIRGYIYKEGLKVSFDSIQ